MRASQAGPAVPEIWDDTFSLGVLPPGAYEVTVVFEIEGGLGTGELGNAGVLPASQVPSPAGRALALLGLALGAAGYGLLRPGRGGGA